jgi:hypothetical protein
LITYSKIKKVIGLSQKAIYLFILLLKKYKKCIKRKMLAFS